MRDQKWSRTRRTYSLVVPLLLVGGLVPSPGLAQFDWRATSIPGFAAGGMAAATVPAFAANSIESGVAVFAAGLVGGAVVGWMIGDAAEDRLARGESLAGGHKNALRTGTVMAGAGAGALASVLVINADDGAGQSEPNDGATFGYFVAGGAALGALTQVLLESRLEPGPVRPRLAIGPEGRTELVLDLDL
jgi:hypothetical protein